MPDQRNAERAWRQERRSDRAGGPMVKTRCRFSEHVFGDASTKRTIGDA